MVGRSLQCRLPLCLVVVTNVLGGCGDGGGLDGGVPELPGTSTSTTTSTQVPPACLMPIDCYPSMDLPPCPEVLPKSVSFAFDPNDPRWAEDYQTCLDEAGGILRPTECDWFCADVVLTNSTLQSAQRLGEASIDCSRPDRPTITVQYYQSHCDPPPPTGPTLTEPTGNRIAVPPGCQVPEKEQRTYSVTFRLHNGGSSPVFLRTDCLPPFEVSSCASAYTDQLANLDFCPCICGSSCPMCGPCLPADGEALDPGATKEWPWTATVLVATGDVSTGTGCKSPSDLPAGRYRFSVPLFASAADAIARAPVLRNAAANFELPAADDVVGIETD